MSNSRRGGNFRHGHSRRNDKFREQYHDYDDYADEEFDTRMPRQNSQRGNRGRPPGLRGKAIGLYYRDIARNKKKNKEEQQYIHSSKESIILTNSVKKLIHSHNSSSKFYKMESKNRTDLDYKIRYSDINDSQFKKKFLNIISGNLQEKLEKSVIAKAQLQSSEVIDIKLLDELNRQKASNEYKKMLRFRSKLPVYKSKKQILNIINANQVVLISGETGSGKTTQIGQIILDNEIECGRGSTTSIICTQPRRISTITLAERVAAERTERLGNSVGYHVRLEKVTARSEGSIVFCTTGMLLQLMQADAALRSYSHIILDEIHERSTESDFILSLLKLIIHKRPDLKIILMSATLNSEQFSKYYNDCPTLSIPGFTYPVQEVYLEDILEIIRFEFPKTEPTLPNWKKYLKKSLHEQKMLTEHKEFIQSYYVKPNLADKVYSNFVLEQLFNPKSESISYDLICELVKYICTTTENGAILIFLPGFKDIKNLNKTLLQNSHFSKDRYIIYPLHSMMPTVEQKQIFNVPPLGTRKIIIATNIAETSITIEDVVYVVDCGKNKLSNFDVENNMQTLDEEWISQANAMQRRGRAGRVQPGVCYFLYTKARASTFEQYPVPEMRRTRLEEVILQIKMFQIGIADTFLATLIDPPDPKALALSLDLLKQLNAIDERENLTPLGYHLAKLPLDPRTGKMIIWAAMFSCIEPIFAIAASLAYKDAFYFPLEKEAEARKKKIELGLNQFSDQIALAEALRLFERKNYMRDVKSFCNEYFLSFSTLKLLSEMKKQFAVYLHEMNFLSSSNPKDRSANRNSNDKSLIKAIVCAGLYPNIAVIKSADHNKVSGLTIENESVQMHPSSINAQVKIFPTPYLTYFLKRKSSVIYLFSTTCVNSLTLIFASPSISFLKKRNGESIITILNKIAFSYNRDAETIQKLHEKLNCILEFKICHPDVIDWNSYEGDMLTAIIRLLSDNDKYFDTQ